MGYATKVQLIRRKASEQYYVNLPRAVARAMDFARGEVVEWSIEDKRTLVLRRRDVPPPVSGTGPEDAGGDHPA
jgi:hypothetical protein